MTGTISCSCGYHGPGRPEGPGLACPICGELAATPQPETKKWRIPCPNGHVFKVADDWIGRQLVCPTCNEPFVPKIADSLEKRAETRRRQEQEEVKFAKRWLARALWAAALFGLLMTTLIVMSVMKR